MSLSLRDRVKETTTTTGTGTLTLVSAPSGFRRFNSALSDGDTTYYCIESGTQWEVGIGTYSANTLARTTVLASSNSNSLINMTASRSFVFITYAAAKAVYKDSSDRIVSGSAGIYFNDGSVQTSAATSADLSPYLLADTASSTYVALGGSYSNPTWITGLAWSKLSGLPSAVSNLSGTNTGDQDLSSYATTTAVANTYLPLAGGTLVGDLKFTDATYDIGKSGATRPRDGWFSRKLNIGSGISLVDNSSSGYGYALLFDGTNSGIENAQNVGLGLLLRGNTVSLVSSSLQSLYSSNNLTLGQTDGPHTVIGGAAVSSTSIAYNRVITRSSDGLHVFNNTLTSAACLGVYETWTSSTSFGRFQVKPTGSAYQIGSAIGSAGGTTRDLDFGYWNSAGTFKQVVTANTTGIFIHENPYRAGEGISITQATNDGRITSTRSLSFYSINGSILISDANQYLFFGGGGQAFVGGTTSVYLRSAKNGNIFINPTDGYDNSGGTYVQIRGCHAWSSSSGTITGGAVLLNGGNGSSGSAGTATGGAVTLTGGTGYGTGVGGAINLVGGSGPVSGGIFVSQGVSTSGSPTLFTVTGAAHTTLTASTEATDVNFNLARTVQFATGALTTQRAFRIQAPTYAFAGASTITTASTLSISGPPIAGTNATITNAYALNVESGETRLGGTLTHAAYSANLGNGSLHVDGSGKVLGWSGTFFGWSSGSYVVAGTAVEFALYRDAAHVMAQRGGTNAQTFRLAETWTSSTSFGAFQIKANTGAAYQIGSAKGSAGGNNRAIEIGHFDSSGTFTSGLSIATDGAATFASTINAMDFSTNNYNLAVGYSTSPSLAFASTAIGWTARSTHSYSIAIGSSATTSAANQLQIGNGTNVSKVRFGDGTVIVRFDNPVTSPSLTPLLLLQIWG